MGTILVAESDRETFEHLRPRLEAMGLKVVVAKDWPDTLRKAGLEHPDLLLVSEDLPQLSTLQMALQLRGVGGMFKTPLVLIISDTTDEPSAEPLRRARVSEAIPRQRLKSRLLELLRRYLPISGSGVMPTAESLEVVRGLPVAADGTVAAASGELGQLSTPSLLGQLACRWSSGALALEKEGVAIRIYLQRGNIVDASCNIPGLALGTLLVQNRLVTEAQLAQAQALSTQRGLTLERALIQQRSLDEQKLRRVQLYQRQHAVLLPFSWRKGSFGFEPGPIEPDRLEPGFGSMEVLFGGLRALRDVHRIESGLPPTSALLRRTQHAFDGFQISKLSESERSLLFLADEGTTIAGIVAQPRLDRSDAIRAFFALYAAGVLEVSVPVDSAVTGPVVSADTAPVQPPPPAEPPDAAQPDPRPAPAAPPPSPPPPPPPQSPRAETEPIGVEEGSLAAMPVAKLLSELYSERRTGVLLLTRQDEQKILHIDHGLIVLARSTLPADAWPRVLLRRGLITPLEARWLDEQPGSDSASEPPIRPESLVWKLQPAWLRIEDIVLGLFGWQAGEYRFEEGPIPGHEFTPAAGRTESLLVEGLRRLGHRAWTTTSLPPVTHYLTARPEAFDLDLGPAEGRLLEELNGQVRIVDLVERKAEFGIEIEPLLHGFLLLGLLDIRRKAAPIDAAQFTERRRRTLERQIRDFTPLAEGDNYFALLGVSPEAGTDDVRTRYKMLREKYHPDRARELGQGELLDTLSDLFGKIYLAYQSLNKVDIRKAHLEELERRALREEAGDQAVESA